MFFPLTTQQAKRAIAMISIKAMTLFLFQWILNCLDHKKIKGYIDKLRLAAIEIFSVEENFLCKLNTAKINPPGKNSNPARGNIKPEYFRKV